eukprot:Gb_17463 [translate_table: standard]
MRFVRSYSTDWAVSLEKANSSGSAYLELDMLPSSSPFTSFGRRMAVEDKLSSLTDDLLCHILSKLDLKCAVKCSILSKRWRFLYTKLSHLKFSPRALLGEECCKPHSKTAAEDIISNVLLLHWGDVESFRLYIENDSSLNQWAFTRQYVCHWVRYTAFHGVKKLYLQESTSTSTPPPPALFSCNLLTLLTLQNYILTAFPAHFSGFNHLTLCVLRYVELTDQSLEQLLLHCPLLEKLCLDGCKGLCNPTISAPNLLYLAIDSEMAGELLTVNCPKLIEISLCKSAKNLRIDRILLHEFSSALEYARVLENGDLQVLCLRCGEGQAANAKFSVTRFVEVVGSFKSLKTLSLNIKRYFESETDKVFPLLSILDGLKDLEALFLYGNFFQGLTRDFIPPCLSVPHFNLHKIDIPIYEFGEKEIALLGCILRSTPALEKMTVHRPKHINDKVYIGFLEQLLGLNRASTAQIKLCS